MVSAKLIAECLADMDAATLPVAFIRAIVYIAPNGQPVTITDKNDLQDFLNRHPRFARIDDGTVVPDLERIRRAWIDEVAYIKERVAWLLTNEGW